MKHYIITFFLSCCVFCSLNAQTPLSEIAQQADSAYTNEDYATAIDLYLQTTNESQDAHPYYNLANAYFRTDSLAKAILWYERALKLEPGNEDIRFNLEFTRSRTIDRITPRHEMFFISFWRSLVYSMSLDSWAHWAFGCFILMIAMVLAFLYLHHLTLRKICFVLAILFFLSTLFTNLCAYGQQYITEHRTGAVVIASSVTLKSTPSASGNDLYVLHEGTTVEIKDNSMKEWAEVSIADGKVGWMPKSALEII